MNERVAVITGAARGIGAETARSLATAGWRMVLVDRCEDDAALSYSLARRDDLDGVVAECGGPDRAVGHVADVRDQSQLEDAVDTAMRRFGRLDAAVAAAGAVAGGQPAWETDDLAWQAMIGVNLEGVWRLARAAVPALLAAAPPREGRFVAVSSMAGIIGLPRLSAYVAAKHAVHGLIRSLAAELGPLGVTANVVAPGSTATAMLDASAAIYGLPDVTGLLGDHLLGRPLAAHEVAALVGWLCSEASSGVTGAILPVDAGATSK